MIIPTSNEEHRLRYRWIYIVHFRRVADLSQLEWDEYLGRMRGWILVIYFILVSFRDSMIQATSHLADGNVERSLGLGTRRGSEATNARTTAR